MIISKSFLLVAGLLLNTGLATPSFADNHTLHLDDHLQSVLKDVRKAVAYGADAKPQLLAQHAETAWRALDAHPSLEDSSYIRNSVRLLKEAAGYGYSGSHTYSHEAAVDALEILQSYTGNYKPYPAYTGPTRFAN